MTSQEHHTHVQATGTPPAASRGSIQTLLAALGVSGVEPTVAELHLAVCGRVRQMRDAGNPPETVLAAVKALAAAASHDAPVRPGAPPTEWPDDGVALVSRVAQWCIAEYFRRD